MTSPAPLRTACTRSWVRSSPVISIESTTFVRPLPAAMITTLAGLLGPDAESRVPV